MGKPLSVWNCPASARGLLMAPLWAESEASAGLATVRAIPNLVSCIGQQLYGQWSLVNAGGCNASCEIPHSYKEHREKSFCRQLGFLNYRDAVADFIRKLWDSG